ncbi:hypothetical protein MIDIC_550004 [Alphaproteobacteria bacterium]
MEMEKLGISKTSVFYWESLKKENGDVSPKKNGNKPTKANREQLMQIITGKSEFGTERNRRNGRNDCNWHILCLSKDGVVFKKKNTLQRSRLRGKRRVLRECRHLSCTPT